MEINNKAEGQRTIKVYVNYRTKRPKQKNNSGTILKLYAARHFTLKPTDHSLLISGVNFELPGGTREPVEFWINCAFDGDRAF